MKKHLTLFSLSLFFLVSCEINQKDISPTDNFIKIYNDPNIDLAYFAESILQLSDGFLILTGKKDYANILNEYPTASLIRTNILGEVIWSLDTEWRTPVSELIDLNNAIGFIGMDNDNNVSFIRINTDSGIEESSTSLDISMPLAAHKTIDEKLVVLSYNYVNKSSAISVFSSDLSLISTTYLFVGDDLIIPIQKHLNKSDTQYPFFIGDWKDENTNGFFVNCFYNYSLGVRFFETNGSSTGGWVYSHQIDNAISSLVFKEGDSYSISRYFNKKNYLSPSVTIDVNTSQNFNDSTQNPLAELVSDAKVKVLKIQFEGIDYILFASTTNSNSIVLYQYSLNDNTQLLTKEISFAHKIEIKGILQDHTDAGILILAQHFVDGKYLRPVLIKVPAKDFETE
jgi:hypothetical protein